MNPNQLSSSFPVSSILQDDLVFDIGANVGAKAMHYLSAGARLVCIEPQPECVRTLEAKFGGNPKVTIVDKGVSSHRGKLELSVCSKANTISTFSHEWKSGRFSAYQWDSSVIVDVVTLDDLIAQFGIPKYCKIDVEGYELAVLQGLSKQIPLLSFEFTTEFFDNARACIKHLQSLGFKSFNVSFGEHEALLSDSWLNAEQLITQLSTKLTSDTWGDIYARSTPRESQNFQTSSIDSLVASNAWERGTPLRLHIGCGEKHLKGYVNIDYPPDEHNVMNVRADYYSDITALSFPNSTVDEIRLHHVFEHFDRVTALALLMTWHRWLKVGGILRIETPDIAGCAATLVSEAPLKVKMGVVRHIAGDQAASWAYHLDHWFPDRYKHTLESLGYQITEIKSSSWPVEPFLSNVECIAVKREDLTPDQQLERADSLLWQSTVADVEKPTWNVWRNQLRQFSTDNKPRNQSSYHPEDAIKQLASEFAPFLSQLPLEDIHFFNQRNRDAWVQMKAAQTPNGATVLDVGAGTCPYRPLFSHCNYKSHDFKKYDGIKLGNTRDYGQIDFTSDITSIPIVDSSLDLVLCTEVLEHVPEPIEALREIARMVKPGGRILITAPLGSGLHQLPYHFYGGYTPEWYNYCANKFGLTVEEISPNGGAMRLLAQECSRIAWTLNQHGHLYEAIKPAVRSLFGELLPRFLFGLEEQFFNPDFTVGYHVCLLKPLSQPTSPPS